MADGDLTLKRYTRSAVITTPKGTAEASAQSSSFAVGQGTLRRLDVIIPAGHVGITGIAVRMAGTRVIPFNETQWLRGNDTRYTVEPDLEVLTGTLTVLSFNPGKFDHDHHLVADMEVFEGAVTAPASPEVDIVAPTFTPVDVLPGPDSDEDGEEPETEVDEPAALDGVAV